MKVSISKNDLSTAFQYVARTVNVSKNAVDAAYKGIQFVFKNNNLFLYTCDGNHFCRAYYGSTEMEDFSFVVEYDLISKLVYLAKEDILLLDIQENSIFLKDGKSRYKMQYMTLIDYSYMFTNIDSEKVYITTLKHESFNKALSFLKQSLPKQENFKHLNGIYFDGMFVVTNIVGLAIYPYTDMISNSIFISLESFQILSNVLQEQNSEVMLCNYKDNFIAESGKNTYLLKCMTDSFPNYKPIVSRIDNHPYKAVIKVNDLRIACKKLVSFTNPIRNNSGKFCFYTDRLIITAASENKMGEETIQIETDGIIQEIYIFINLARLIILISHIKEKEIIITFSKSLKEYVIKNGDAVYIEGTLPF